MNNLNEKSSINLTESSEWIDENIRSIIASSHSSHIQNIEKISQNEISSSNFNSDYTLTFNNVNELYLNKELEEYSKVEKKRALDNFDEEFVNSRCRRRSFSPENVFFNDEYHDFCTSQYQDANFTKNDNYFIQENSHNLAPNNYPNRNADDFNQILTSYNNNFNMVMMSSNFENQKTANNINYSDNFLESSAGLNKKKRKSCNSSSFLPKIEISQYYSPPYDYDKNFSGSSKYKSDLSSYFIRSKSSSLLSSLSASSFSNQSNLNDDPKIQKSNRSISSKFSNEYNDELNDLNNNNNTSTPYNHKTLTKHSINNVNKFNDLIQFRRENNQNVKLAANIDNDDQFNPLDKFSEESNPHQSAFDSFSNVPAFDKNNNQLKRVIGNSLNPLYSNNHLLNSSSYDNIKSLKINQNIDSRNNFIENNVPLLNSNSYDNLNFRAFSESLEPTFSYDKSKNFLKNQNCGDKNKRYLTIKNGNNRFLKSKESQNISILKAQNQQNYHFSQYRVKANSNEYNETDQIVLHVQNLDYKISSDEWKRILLENFRKHCKESLTVNVLTNPDKSLLGVVKLASKEDARLAISCLHHKKIGYKRLSVNIAFSTICNSLKSKIIALLRESNEMPLTSFIELYESRYNQTITLSELFKLKEIVYISQSKEGQGRKIRLNTRNLSYSNRNNLINSNNNIFLETEIQQLLHTSYCTLHSNNIQVKQDQEYLNSNQCNTNSFLPNVIVSLRSFKSAVHKLLNDHGGQMPLHSFLDCYKCCIFNNNSNKSDSYQLKIDTDNGVSLEHLITCAQDVQIQYSEGFFKQLQWENDKSKPASLNFQAKSKKNSLNYDIFENGEYLFEEMQFTEESQRKLNHFSHEVIELLKGVPRCIVPISKFNNEYQKKYGKQCRVADFGFTKLNELLESIPSIIQIIDGEFEKKLTLTHRVQVRRFSNDILKVIKSTHSPSKEMFADEYPNIYEKHFSKKFDIRDYGVCFLEDMLAELPESIISRKEIEGKTFIQIPKIIQMNEELLCMHRLTFEIIDMLKHKPRFSIQFNKFIPNFHHHFGRQCKLSNYGFTKLIELLEAIPNTVQIITKDGLQFVQLRKEIMLDLITHNIVKLVEENNFKIQISLAKLEHLYNMKYQKIYYADFNCVNFGDLYTLLNMDKYSLRTVLAATTSLVNEIEFNHYFKNLNEKNSTKTLINDKLEWLIQVEALNEKELKKNCKLILNKLMENLDKHLLAKINEFNEKGNKRAFYFSDFIDLILANNNQTNDLNLTNQLKNLNRRSFFYVVKILSDYFCFISCKTDVYNPNIIITGLSSLYIFAKQIRNVYKSKNLLDMNLAELEGAYRQFYKNGIDYFEDNFNKIDGNSIFPYKRLGFTDINLLFSQGLNLVITVKKYNDKRLCLNKEFWPKSFLDSSSVDKANNFAKTLSVNQRK